MDFSGDVTGSVALVTEGVAAGLTGLFVPVTEEDGLVSLTGTALAVRGIVRRARPEMMLNLILATNMICSLKRRVAFVG